MLTWETANERKMAVKTKEEAMIDLYDWCVISSHWIKPPVLLKWTQEAVGFIHCQRDEWHSGSKQRRRKSCPRRHSIRGFWAAAALCSAAPDLDASPRSSRVSLQLHHSAALLFLSQALSSTVPEPRRSPPLRLSTGTRSSLTGRAERSRLHQHQRPHL